MNFDFTRFKTLLLREWLQNRWTWLVVVGLIPALILVTLPFGEVKIPLVNREGQNMLQISATVVLALGGLVCATVAWLTVLFMATGLGRRDVQDRSIEFWLSLPSGHAESIGATYVAHALLFPIGALLAGLAAGALISPLLMLKWQGLAALGGVAWGAALMAGLNVALLGLFCLLLLAIWLAPVVLLLMAAAAWLKRLALPLLAIASLFLANLPSTAETFRGFVESFGERAGAPLAGAVQLFAGNLGMNWGDGAPRNLTVGDYLGRVAGDLASPQMAVGLGLALLCLCLLVVRRRQGG